MLVSKPASARDSACGRMKPAAAGVESFGEDVHHAGTTPANLEAACGALTATSRPFALVCSRPVAPIPSQGSACCERKGIHQRVVTPPLPKQTDWLRQHHVFYNDFQRVRKHTVFQEMQAAFRNWVHASDSSTGKPPLWLSPDQIWNEWATDDADSAGAG